MQPYRLLPPLFPLFVLAACTEQEPPTAPAEPGSRTIATPRGTRS
jgi:hypothetical protein